VLLLTKPLGTGVLFQAMKNGLRTDEETAAMIASMATLNKRARDRMVEAGIRCATDVTGFGLAGHALNIARASGVDVILEAGALPMLPGVAGYLEKQIFPGTTNANLTGYGDGFVRGEGVSDSAVRLAADPQTSGGMLIAAPRKRAAKLAELLGAAAIGELREPETSKPAVRLLVRVG
jgi:selenide,water dikinase